jgi:hypothetical protein
MAVTADLHLNDIGTQILITIKEGNVAVDLSTAITMQFDFKRKDGTTFTVDADHYTDGTDGILEYITEAGDISQVGKWSVQPYLELPNWEGHTQKVDFRVGDLIAG